jgi:hypothetical protein
VPPVNHPSHPSSDPSTPGRPSQYDGSADAGGTPQGSGNYRDTGVPRRRPVGASPSTQKSQQDRERDCIVM